MATTTNSAVLHEKGIATNKTIFEISNEFLNQRKDATNEEKKKCRILMTHQEITSVIDKVAAEIDARFGASEKPPVLVGILKGVFIFMSDLCQRLTIPYHCSFVTASSYGAEQTQNHTVQLLTTLVRSEFENRPVILLDELADNGKTLDTVRCKLIEMGVPENSITTCVLFRKDTTSTHPKPDIVGIDNLPNVWLVGYGLDDCGAKRGWKHLYAVPKAPGVPKDVADVIFEEGEAGSNGLASIRARIVANLPKQQQ